MARFNPTLNFLKVKRSKLNLSIDQADNIVSDQIIAIYLQT